MSADGARHIFSVKHTFLLLQCSFLPKFSIHIETKYEDNKGSNDSVSMTPCAKFDLILFVNHSLCLEHGGLSVWEKGHTKLVFCPSLGVLVSSSCRGVPSEAPGDDRSMYTPSFLPLLFNLFLV